jgi:PilZ domain-containing protein
MRNINRRESPRIEIQLWCHVTSPALWARSAMYTENISRNGMLVAWRGENGPLPPPTLGQIVTIEVELPANHGFGQKCMHVQGTVLRVSDSGQGFAKVAMRVNYMDFRAFHARLRSVEALKPEAQPWMA